MQQLVSDDIFREVKRTRIKKLEVDLSQEVINTLFICPFCEYVGRRSNKKGTAKIFEHDNFKLLKCFNCGEWRKF